MKYLLDTCIISYFVRGEENILNQIKEKLPTELAISTITSMEIEFGLQLNFERSKKIKPIITALLNSIHIIPFTYEDGQAAAIVRANLKNNGTPIGPYDVLLAGCALNRKLTFVTANAKEFRRVAGLMVQDWR